jgi:hypothetical protein
MAIFCGDCEFVHPREDDQTRYQNHECTKYKVRLYHYRDHPNLYRALECRLMEIPTPPVLPIERN